MRTDAGDSDPALPLPTGRAVTSPTDGGPSSGMMRSRSSTSARHRDGYVPKGELQNELDRLRAEKQEWQALLRQERDQRQMAQSQNELAAEIHEKNSRLESQVAHLLEQMTDLRQAVAAAATPKPKSVTTEESYEVPSTGTLLRTPASSGAP